MDSLNIFDDRDLPEAPPPPPRRRPLRRPLGQVVAVSGLVPGAGHVLLGKVREGGLLLLGLALAPVVAVGAFWIGAPVLCWVALRAGALLGLYGLADAPLALLEEADGRRRLHPVPPRQALLENLLTGGLGYERLGLRRWAVAGASILLLQLGLAWWWSPALWIAEGLLDAAGLDAWRQARSRQRKTSSPCADSTPTWLRGTLAGALVLAVAVAVSLQALAVAYEAARHPRSDGVVALEPFYENPHYDLRLEMPSPGWDFHPPHGDALVRATHLTEDAALSLRLRPRLPLGPGAEAAAFAAVEEARRQGWDLRPATGGPARLGRLEGFALTAAGVHDGRPRRVRVVAAVSGLRAWTLWYEWTPASEAFAAGEMDALLASLDLR